jgi:maleylpyruvate isomerase
MSDATQRPHSIQATDGVMAVRRSSALLLEIATSLEDATAAQRSLLPGWSRKHVISHLARGADGMVNLLTWARTGEAQALYVSREARDADIEAGTGRQLSDLLVDLREAEQRFLDAADALTAASWATTLSTGLGTVEAAVLPWGRLTELLVHLVDLDVGHTFDDAVLIADEQLVPLLDYVVWRAGATGAPPMELEVDLPTGETRVWSIGEGGTAIKGMAADIIGWLTARTSGARLAGHIPEVPTWP